jgi:hypothetical protein
VAKQPAVPPATTAQKPLLGRYVDRCGTQYHIAVRPPYGFGLYPADAPAGSPPHQSEVHELLRLLSFDSFTRLSL